MDSSTQNAFLTEYNRSKKSVGFSYFMWFLFGIHYAYNRKIGLQFVYWFTLGGFFVWAFIDLFRMPLIVQGSNSVIAREIANRWNTRLGELPKSASGPTGVSPVNLPPTRASTPQSPPAGSGVTQQQWNAMTPEQRKLWQ
jgi:hypothetical protein